MANRTRRVDPARFIVRNEEIPQSAEYPFLCAQLAEALIRAKPRSINDAVALVQQVQEGMPLANRFAGRDEYFKPAPIITDESEKPLRAESLAAREKAEKSPMVERYKARMEPRWLKRKLRTDYSQVIEYSAPRLRDSQGEALSGKDGGTGLRVSFSEIQYDTKQGDFMILHPLNLETEKFGHHSSELYQHEHRWALISHAYSKAMDESLPAAKRESQALELYWLLSGDEHFIRGQATFSRVMLEYLSHEIGFEVPYTKPGYNLNEEALTRSIGDFKSGWRQGEYFDPAATAKGIFEWQQQAIAHQALG